MTFTKHPVNAKRGSRYQGSDTEQGVILLEIILQSSFSSTDEIYRASTDPTLARNKMRSVLKLSLPVSIGFNLKDSPFLFSFIKHSYSMYFLCRM